jgi:hypothetical protein
VRESARLVFGFLPDERVQESGVNAVAICRVKDDQVKLVVAGRWDIRRDIVRLNIYSLGYCRRRFFGLNGRRVSAVEKYASQVSESEKSDNSKGRKFKRAKVGNKPGQVHHLYPFSM